MGDGTCRCALAVPIVVPPNPLQSALFPAQCSRAQSMAIYAPTRPRREECSGISIPSGNSKPPIK